MRLLEHEGKALFATYGIPVPQSRLITSPAQATTSGVLKAQVHSGNRKASGGIRLTESQQETQKAAEEMFGLHIQGEIVTTLLLEERIEGAAERFMSFLYDPEKQGPVLLLSKEGGSGIETRAPYIFPIDMTKETDEALFSSLLQDADFADREIAPLASLLTKAWTLFITEGALVVEINPLFVRSDGNVVAGDAKVELDDALVAPQERPFVDLEGDIALLASGGGASMIALDALVDAGGAPANYTEYSGNPPPEVVAELTQRVLSKPGLRGCFVVGAAANFTDIEATLTGFLTGLRTVVPKPTYPIVIRRDGPRREEAFRMLEEAGRTEGYDFHLYDASTSIVESARIMATLSKAYTP